MTNEASGLLHQAALQMERAITDVEELFAHRAVDDQVAISFSRIVLTLDTMAQTLSSTSSRDQSVAFSPVIDLMRQFGDRLTQIDNSWLRFARGDR